MTTAWRAELLVGYFLFPGVHYDTIANLMTYRICCIRRPRCVQLLHRNEEPQDARKGNHAKRNKV